LLTAWLYANHRSMNTAAASQAETISENVGEISYLRTKLKNISNSRFDIKLERRAGHDYFAYYELQTDDPDLTGFGYITNLKIDREQFRKIYYACQQYDIPVDWACKRLFYESRLGANSGISPTSDGSMFQINKNVLATRGYTLQDIESDFDLALDMFIWYYDVVLRKYKREHHTKIYMMGETKYMKILKMKGIDVKSILMAPPDERADLIQG